VSHVKKPGVVMNMIAYGSYKMLTAIIKLLIIIILLNGCQIMDTCDPEESLPYSKSELIYEAHCSQKCCEFVVDKEAETCHEMWCYRDCEWTMNHQSCY